MRGSNVSAIKKVQFFETYYINWKDIEWSKKIPEIIIIIQTLSNCRWSLSKTGGHMQCQKTTWNSDIKTYFMEIQKHVMEVKNRK